ncbi:MAG TPA: efflux RND transporter periplasmic adaptor subunit [Thermoanaerobaculia bacterium]|jgi:HlyD family secretion protein|nr:efflux RND transporter periplasmic adaptor subunit [Thermoanaerobaculia bacterium]
MKRALITIAVLAALGGIVAASVVRRNGESRGVAVRAEKVERRPITHVVKATGQIDPRVKVNVSAHVVARIEKLHAREGEQVVAGQPFVELEKETFVAAHDRAKAQLAMAETSVRQAEIDLADAGLKLRRTQRLREEQVVPDERLEAAELAESSARLRVDQSKEQVSQARADLEKAVDELRKTTIHAPITGRVILLNAEEGEVVISGTMHNEASVIGIIADLSEILVEVLADETDIVQVQLGQPATVDVDALPGSAYTGKVVEIGNAGVSLTTQPDVTFFRVKILLDNPDGRLLSGMSARASIEVAGHDSALVVPIESVVFRPPVDAAEGADEIQVVLIAKDDGTVDQRPVEVGISDVTHVEIASGVAEGEQVITGPHRVLENLKPSDHVRITTGEGEEEEPEREGFGPFD